LGKRPLEILNLSALAGLLLLAVLSGLAGRLPPWRWAAAAYGCSIAMVLLVGRLARDEGRLPRIVRWMVNFYPVVLIPIIFQSLGAIIAAVNPGWRDRWLMEIDQALLGEHLAVWLEKLAWGPLRDVLYLAYASFYLFGPVVGLWLWQRSAELSRRFIFTVTLTFFISYVGYFIVPARGPRVVLSEGQMPGPERTGIARAISTRLDELEHTKQDAFPSGHTMVAAVCVYYAFRHARRLFVVLLPVGLLLVISTVYIRYHYVVDVLAGLVLAAGMPGLGEWLYGKLARGDPAAKAGADELPMSGGFG
jgi:membrane-associated phospholipid phosphatase